MGIIREAIERKYGGWGVREKNEEGEMVTYVAMTIYLSIVNTFFENIPNQIATYKSGGLQEWRKAKSDRLLNVKTTRTT